MAIHGMYLVNHGAKGTARRAFQNMPYESAGKSGTAQVFGLAEGQKYNASELAEHLHDHALFTGFAPVKIPKLSSPSYWKMAAAALVMVRQSCDKFSIT